MKIRQLLFLSLCVTLLNAHQKSSDSRVMRSDCATQKTNQAYHDDGNSDGEMIEFDVDDSDIDTANLVPLWARWANKVAAPLFVLYSHVNKWWNTKQEVRHKRPHNVHCSR